MFTTHLYNYTIGISSPSLVTEVTNTTLVGMSQKESSLKNIWEYHNAVAI